MRTTFKSFLNEDKVYRGIGDKINVNYGFGTDDGMGEFWTDNLTMAKWFAGMVEYDVDVEHYVNINNHNGYIKEKELNLKNPYIIDDTHPNYDIDYDSFQIYFDEINEAGGVDYYKNDLIKNGHDGIILKKCTTNYYQDGFYSIYIVF